MRAYFFQPAISNNNLSDQYGRIAEILRNAGVFVVSSSNENNTDFRKEDLEAMQQSGEILLDKMDCFVIEASQPDQEIGYLLAYAISQKKPLLYLFHKNTPDRVSHGYLTKKNTPEFVCMEEYSRESLEQVLMNFIDDVTSGKGLKQRPTIKFTLRITPRMERYLEQKAKRSKKTKADYLRDLIDKLMEGEGK
ncbi:MAG: hypothetical protein HZC01_00220 [Candidatus Kerfeldbacteria bacterium]|nr:hypothetical protein [Candidatus Kerfeldbacteria bacterium]